MSLTAGRGPLSGKPAGRFNAPVPAGLVYVEPHPRRVRGVRNGEAVIDSERVVLVHGPGAPPTYAFPAGDVRTMDGLDIEPVAELEGYVRVAWGAVDTWCEEDEDVVGHPRNPYHRIDCLRTSRRLHVDVEGVALVDGPASIALYETGLEPRLYVGREQIRMDLLHPSETTTYCPYKGTASYWTARIDGAELADVAWCYEDPLPESTAIRGLLSFEPARSTVRTDLPPPAF